MAPDLNPSDFSQGSCLKHLSIDEPVRLPVIDLSGLDGPQHDQVVDSIVKAAENFGFFQVVNHGMAVEFLDELKDAVYEFFGQPEEKKAVYIPEESSQTQPLVIYNKGTWPDPIDVLVMTSTDEQEAQKYWPDSCKEVSLKFRKSSSELAERILRILMSNLEVTLDESMGDSYMGAKYVSMNYYPTYTSQKHEVAAVRKHTDTSTLTVLLQDHIGGLSGKLNEDGDIDNNYKGEWVEITPIPGALIILVGDVLQVLSNGKYVAGYHCVQTTGRVTRVSIPAFMNPRSSAKIGPLPQAVEKDGGKPRYREFLYEEYFSNAVENYIATSPDVKPIHAFEIMAQKD